MTKRICKGCGVRIIEYPVYKGQEESLPLLTGETPGDKFKSLFTRETMAKINWRNLIIGDWTKGLILFSLILVAFAYGYDTQACRELLSDPCQFAEDTKQYCEQQAQLQSKVPLTPVEEWYIDSQQG